VSELAVHQKIKGAAGEAIGKISSINHIQLIVRDMEESVLFYRDILGLEVVKTTGKSYLDNVSLSPITRNYFFKMGNGELLTLIELKDAPVPEPSIWDLWPASLDSTPHIRKMDHLAFNVDSLAELEWFRQHFIRNGVKVTDILGRERFVKSIYFVDPTGNALEIATWAPEDPAWQDHKPEDWMLDSEPVSSLLEP
jgi:catechol 2,3-dioxygenase-like lactoylglutathione lyase family enzyme